MKFKNKLKQAKQIATGISDVHKCPYCNALMAEIKDHARNGHKPKEETSPCDTCIYDSEVCEKLHQQYGNL